MLDTLLQDALLAWFHYLAIFLLVVIMTAQAVLLRPGLSGDIIRRLGLYDRFYQVSAMAVLITGLLRLFLGIKGVDFFLRNPWFHAKITLFVVIWLCSIPPTLAFLRWRKLARQQPGYTPSDIEIKRARLWVILETHLFIMLPLCAAMMARGFGL